MQEKPQDVEMAVSPLEIQFEPADHPQSPDTPRQSGADDDSLIYQILTQNSNAQNFSGRLTKPA